MEQKILNMSLPCGITLLLTGFLARLTISFRTFLSFSPTKVTALKKMGFFLNTCRRTKNEGQFVPASGSLKKILIIFFKNNTRKFLVKIANQPSTFACASSPSNSVYIMFNCIGHCKINNLHRKDMKIQLYTIRTSKMVSVNITTILFQTQSITKTPVNIGYTTNIPYRFHILNIKTSRSKISS